MEPNKRKIIVIKRLQQNSFFSSEKQLEFLLIQGYNSIQKFNQTFLLVAGQSANKSNSILAQNQRYFTSPSQHSRAAKAKDTTRISKKLIVALKTIDQSEGLDYWLTLYDRRLFPLRQNEILMCHFARLAQNKTKVITKGDFEMIKVIGKGGFSRVILSRKKDTGRLYAIKIMKKAKIIKEKKVRPILSERSVLEQIDHPFIIKLHWAFQTKQELFFVLDLCTGGEIFFHLNHLKYFSEQVAKFYFSEVLLGLEYLHDKNIVFRDLKPENILLDIDGHVKIADFGLAKVIPERQKSYSFCGSPEYMSPEMLTGKGHDRQLDYYCLGAFLYEMLCGLPPFYNKSTDKMYQNILREKLTFPESFNKYPLVKDLLRKLMEKNLEKRFKGVREIRAHPWFSDVNWEDLMQKKVQPPFIPSVYESNFDQAYLDLPVDFDEGPIARSQISTERRQSYYIESSIQSRKITEHSYLHEKGNLQFDTDHCYDMSQSINQTQLNNFFLNPHEDCSIIDQSAINKPANNQGQVLDTSTNSQLINLSENASSFRQGNQQIDEFQNFSFYDSPYEENQILDSIKNCCIKIASLPEALCKSISNPLDNQEMSYHLENISSHMKKWARSAKKTINEELIEETPIQNQKSLKIRELDTPIQNFSSQLSTDRKKEERKVGKNLNKIKKRIKTPVAKYKEPSKILQVDQISNFNDWNKAISKGDKDTAHEEQTEKCEIHSNLIKSISRECHSSHFESSHNSIAEEMNSNESIELNQYKLDSLGDGYKTQQVKKNLNSLDIQNPEQNTIFQGLRYNFMRSVVSPEFQGTKFDQKLLDQTEYGLSSPIKLELTSNRTASFVPKPHTEESKDSQQNSSRKQKQSVDQVFERAKQTIKVKQEQIQTKKFQEFFNAAKQKETNNPKKSRNHEYGYVSQTPEFQFYSTCQPATLEHLQSLKLRNGKLQPVKAQLQMTQKLEPKMSKQIQVLTQNSDRVQSSTKNTNLNLKVLDAKSQSRSPSGLRSEGKNQKSYKSYIYESDPIYGVKKLAIKKKRSPTNSPQRINLLEKALKLSSSKKESSLKVMNRKLMNNSKQGLSSKNKIEVSPVSVKGKISCEPSKKGQNKLQINKFNSHKVHPKKPSMQLSKVNIKSAQSPLIFKNHMQKSVPLIESFKSALTKQKSEKVQFQPFNQEEQNHFHVNTKDIFNWRNVQDNLYKSGQDNTDNQLKCIKTNSAQLLKANGQKQVESRASRNRDQTTGFGQNSSKKVIFSLSTQSVQKQQKHKK